MRWSSLAHRPEQSPERTANAARAHRAALPRVAGVALTAEAVLLLGVCAAGAAPGPGVEWAVVEVHRCSSQSPVSRSPIFQTCMDMFGSKSRMDSGLVGVWLIGREFGLEANRGFLLRPQRCAYRPRRAPAWLDVLMTSY